MTLTETAVAAMWAELLGVAPSSVDDDFFELGGQSLTMVRFIARVQETYGVELPIDRLFAGDFTVAEAARAIDHGRLEAAGDDEIAALVAELESLSDEDVLALFAEDE
ncbi:phosphopantetheine-binding protein [Sphaerisporangium sp. NPDC051017]|uniref:phosphopantetheine-binding protein n=1 Tax=Sphaerisporangium sp. NPDC051017 TaxID=3154636 RepID=UPI00342DFB7B